MISPIVGKFGLEAVDFVVAEFSCGVLVIVGELVREGGDVFVGVGCVSLCSEVVGRVVEVEVEKIAPDD